MLHGHNNRPVLMSLGTLWNRSKIITTTTITAIASTFSDNGIKGYRGIYSVHTHIYKSCAKTPFPIQTYFLLFIYLWYTAQLVSFTIGSEKKHGRLHHSASLPDSTVGMVNSPHFTIEEREIIMNYSNDSQRIANATCCFSI